MIQPALLVTRPLLLVESLGAYLTGLFPLLSRPLMTRHRPRAQVNAYYARKGVAKAPCESRPRARKGIRAWIDKLLACTRPVEA